MMVYGRSRIHLRGKRAITPQESWIRVEDAYKGVVSKVLFDRAQTRLQSLTKLPSDEEMLAPLRELFVRHGYLSAVLIDQQDDMPSFVQYARRFGGVRNAYRRVGYNHTRLARFDSKTHWQRDEILKALRGLLDHEGYLTRDLIRSQQNFPRDAEIRREFGGFEKVYELMGYPAGKFGHQTRKNLSKKPPRS